MSLSNSVDSAVPRTLSTRVVGAVLAAAQTSVRMLAASPVLPVLPGDGTQPMAHLQNALAMWATSWEACARQSLSRRAAGSVVAEVCEDVAEVIDAARRTKVVARAVASAQTQDDVSALLVDAERRLLAWICEPMRFAPAEVHLHIRDVLDACSDIRGRLRSPSDARIGLAPRTLSVS